MSHEETKLLNSHASFEACQSWLKGFLSVKEYKEVIEAFALKNEEPTGSTILQWEASDLFRLGLPKTAIPKIVTQIISLRVATTDTQNQRTANITPLVDTVNQVELPTTAPKKHKQPVVFTKHRHAKQPRLSNGFDVAATRRTQNDDEEAEEDIEEEEAQQEELDPANNPEDDIAENKALATGYATRNRKARTAAIASASRRVQQVEPLRSGSASSDTEDDSGDNGMANHRNARAARPQRAADLVVEDAVEDNDAPEEPDDGVHPRNGAMWESAAREGMENILKLMPAEKLRDIVTEEGWEFNKICRYSSRKRDGTRQTKFRTSAFMAGKLVKMLMDGQLGNGTCDAGGTTWDGVDDFLTKYVDEEYIKGYVERVLKLKFATPPKISDTRRLLWRLWSKAVPAKGDCFVNLGRITIPYSFIGAKLAKEWREEVAMAAGLQVPPGISITRIYAALNFQEADEENDHVDPGAAPAAADILIKPDPGQQDAMVDDKQAVRHRIAQATVAANINLKGKELVLFQDNNDEDAIDYDDLVEHIMDLKRRNNRIKVQCSFDLRRRLLFMDFVIDMKDCGELLITTAYTKRNEEYDPDAEEEVNRRKFKLVQIWLDKILEAMDHLKGTDFIDIRLEELNLAWNNSCDDLEAREVPLELFPGSELDNSLFDKLMAGVEDFDRPSDADIEDFCHNSGEVSLNFRPYQVRALSFMMREEKAPGGTSRHLWLRVPLPGNESGVECWMSPSLFQLYLTKSATAAQQNIGTSGGSGWQALEMGMGKTAVIIAGIVYNPPPRGWRAARRWIPFKESDFMATVAENKPRGGTLIVVPATLVHQWKLEIEKTLENPEALSILDWSGTKRTLDCNEIASYDIVISTPQNASKCSTLSSIFWHRVVIDEAQLNAGSLMSRGSLMSSHRWIVTGTPCNSTPDSLGPSLDFLRLGGYDVAQRLIPPALSTVLRAVMLRYTKNGRINGQQNLILQGLTERELECRLNEQDEKHYSAKAEKIMEKCKSHISAKKKNWRQDLSIDEVLNSPDHLDELASDREGKIINRRHMQSYIRTIRSLAAGGTKVATGDLVYNEETEEHEHAMSYLTSKSEAILSDLALLKRSEPSAKILIFSEFPDALKLVERGLPDIGLRSRALYGATVAQKRGEHIQEFMDPSSGIQVFLLAARGNSAGITLTAATHIYLMEPLLNPSMELQAIGRAHRMGQQQHVTVTRMYMKDTVEEKVRSFVARRAGHQDYLSTFSKVNSKSAEIMWNLSEVWEMVKYERPERDDTDGDDDNDNDLVMLMDNDPFISTSDDESQ